jgi:5-methylcytosine-specific restriction endonuclease McrA
MNTDKQKREKRNTYMRAYYAANYEKILERRADPVNQEHARKWREINRERNLEVKRKHYAANCEKWREYYANPTNRKRSKKWRKANREKCRQYRHTRRATEGSYTTIDIVATIECQDGICFYCDDNIRGRHSTVDHFIPIVKGGTNWPRNIRIACMSCNQSKNAKMPWDFKPKVFRYDPNEARRNYEQGIK